MSDMLRKRAMIGREEKRRSAPPDLDLLTNKTSKEVSASSFHTASDGVGKNTISATADDRAGSRKLMSEEEVSSLVHNALRRARQATSSVSPRRRPQLNLTGGSRSTSQYDDYSSAGGTSPRSPKSLQNEGEPGLGYGDNDFDAPTESVEELQTAPLATVSSSEAIIRRVEEEIANARRAAQEANRRLAGVSARAGYAPPRPNTDARAAGSLDEDHQYDSAMDVLGAEFGVRSSSSQRSGRQPRDVSDRRPISSPSNKSRGSGIIPDSMKSSQYDSVDTNSSRSVEPPNIRKMASLDFDNPSFEVEAQLEAKGDGSVVIQGYPMVSYEESASSASEDPMALSSIGEPKLSLDVPTMSDLAQGLNSDHYEEKKEDSSTGRADGADEDDGLELTPAASAESESLFEQAPLVKAALDKFSEGETAETGEMAAKRSDDIKLVMSLDLEPSEESYDVGPDPTLSISVDAGEDNDEVEAEMIDTNVQTPGAANLGDDLSTTSNSSIPEQVVIEQDACCSDSLAIEIVPTRMDSDESDSEGDWNQDGTTDEARKVVVEKDSDVVDLSEWAKNEDSSHDEKNDEAASEESSNMENEDGNDSDESDKTPPGLTGARRRRYRRNKKKRAKKKAKKPVALKADKEAERRKADEEATKAMNKSLEQAGDENAGKEDSSDEASSASEHHQEDTEQKAKEAATADSADGEDVNKSDQKRVEATPEVKVAAKGPIGNFFARNFSGRGAVQPSPTKQVQAPVKAPTNAPTKTPVKAPTNTTVKAPTNTTVKAPTNTTVKAPIKAPTKADKVPIKAEKSPFAVPPVTADRGDKAVEKRRVEDAPARLNSSLQEAAEEIAKRQLEETSEAEVEKPADNSAPVEKDAVPDKSTSTGRPGVGTRMRAPSPQRVALVEHRRERDTLQRDTCNAITREVTGATPSKDLSDVSRVKKVKFRQRFPVPPPIARPRKDEDILADNEILLIKPTLRLSRPKKDLLQLLDAASDSCLQRRSNACGALKVLSMQAKNKMTLVRTQGFLEAIIVAASENIVPKSRDVAIEARTRAFTTILNVTEPKENRIIVFAQPNLLQAVIKCINEDTGGARTAACGTLALLAKTPACREPMSKNSKLLDVLAYILKGAAATEQPFLQEIAPQYSADDEGTEGEDSFSSHSSHSSTDSHSDAGGIPQIGITGVKSMRALQEEHIDSIVRRGRLNACAALLHMSKQCTAAPHLQSHDTLMDAIVAVAHEFDDPIHTKCLELLCNLTRFPSNNVSMARHPGLVDTLVVSGRVKIDMDRLWAMRCLQNLSTHVAGKTVLASSEVLELLSVGAMRTVPEEQYAATATLYNLSTEPGAVVPLTNTKNVVATLVHAAHSPDTPSEIRSMACDALATLGLWLQTLSGAGTIPDDLKESSPLPSYVTSGWDRWD